MGAQNHKEGQCLYHSLNVQQLSNNANHYIFKEDLEKLVNEIGIEIRIAHYPPDSSKYNPIEHRLFPHVTRAGQGVIFTNIELVK